MEEMTLLSPEEEALLDSIVEEAHQEIPSLSPSLFIDESTLRFSSAVWYENIQKKTIILAGCGGIGSWVGLLLARMKPKSLFLYDDDIVEPVNISGQLYEHRDVGKYKTQALTEKIKEYTTGHSIFASYERYTDNTEACDIMICGFDNMEARKMFFNNWKKHVSNSSNKEACLFIDGRLASEEFQILCIKGSDTYNIQRYEKEFLFSDDEADETICSYRQTSFCANMIASYMVNLFVNFCANEVGAYRELPFLSTYNAEIMFFKTES